ncbi:DNA-directed DNA polymerase II small subunit [Candidatus Micrarchaeota archaeon]|nr:DNA-directed DNA polymerase II small subunit [Candidatus Micrarchaeota archaeon]MBU1166266.1 DNA-directed DNA polymerase II small subunit [Candidatus Micrarchaeota archaeon]MBU1886741.1 DNA-directed DNA polymerase II small subunit [Candidatus Micrarchaeota archaeon]
MLNELSQRGIRLTLDAEDFIKSNNSDGLLQKLIDLKKPLISKEDVEILVQKNMPGDEVIVNKTSDFIPLAKEYAEDIKVNHMSDVTGKSRTKGEVSNFISYFRNRFQRVSRFLKKTGATGNIDLADVKRHLNEKARIIVLISGKRETKKGNLLFDVEDMTGTFKVVVSSSKNNEKLMEKAQNVLSDDIVAFTGKILEPYIIAEDIEWPDIPVIREKHRSENDVATAYLSDIHFGSRYFLGNYLQSFVDWLHGKGEMRELAGKIKYILIAGDVVDGIGIYPNQEKELVVKDIQSQYRMFNDFVESLPDYIKVIVAPGNHDAVRRGEPQPALGSDLVTSNALCVGNPSRLSIEGINHLVYHGTSIDSMIASLPDSSYVHPEKVMVEYLKRRHLSPIYGGNLIIPENVDYMVIDDPPDIFHCGHVHKNGYTQYRGTLVINSGTFQDRTDFQVKQGHVPTPALVPVYEMKSGRLHTLDFKI